MKKNVSIKVADIPPVVRESLFVLQQAGFEAYLVGGCVRDLFLGRQPKDWDITTNALPEEVLGLYPHSFYTNNFGTVGIVHDEIEDMSLKNMQITTYRTEANYSDYRRPDNVSFSKSIEEDLQRRDFTMNAIALTIEKRGENVSRETQITIVDPFHGKQDIANKIIRTVGNPDERFGEDALRIMRAVRFQAELNFVIEVNTMTALANNAPKLQKIAQERIQDEFSKILLSPNPMIALATCERLDILQYIVPELLDTIGVEQKGTHIYTVWEHLLRSLQLTADKGWDLDLRLAALFHDIGKPATQRWVKGKEKPTFYGHEVVGAKMTKKILKRLKYPRETVSRVTKLVRWHMFFSDPDQISLSAVRRMIRNVGKEDIWALMDLRVADRIGTGRPKEKPYRLRKYHAMIEEAMHDPVSVGMLKIDGAGVMKVTRETPGPKIGLILNALMEEVLDDPKKNNEDYLVSRVTELNNLDLEILTKLAEAGKEKQQSQEEEEIAKLRAAHHVK